MSPFCDSVQQRQESFTATRGGIPSGILSRARGLPCRLHVEMSKCTVEPLAHCSPNIGGERYMADQAASYDHNRVVDFDDCRNDHLKP